MPLSSHKKIYNDAGKLALFLLCCTTLHLAIGCASDSNKPVVAIPHSPDTTSFYPVNSKDPLQPEYDSAASYLWRNFVPMEGQATTRQGEMIRIIEKLDNEIRGNAKANWNDQFVLLANSLRDMLIQSHTFTKEIEIEIENDIDVLTRSEEELYLEDDVYNRLTRRIVEWHWRHKQPVAHTKNPALHI